MIAKPSEMHKCDVATCAHSICARERYTQRRERRSKQHTNMVCNADTFASDACWLNYGDLSWSGVDEPMAICTSTSMDDACKISVADSHTYKYKIYTHMMRLNGWTAMDWHWIVDRLTLCRRSARHTKEPALMGRRRHMSTAQHIITASIKWDRYPLGLGGELHSIRYWCGHIFLCFVAACSEEARTHKSVTFCAHLRSVFDCAVLCVISIVAQVSTRRVWLISIGVERVLQERARNHKRNSRIIIKGVFNNISQSRQNYFEKIDLKKTPYSQLLYKIAFGQTPNMVNKCCFKPA